MNRRFEDELPRSLADGLRAIDADAVDDDAVETAQQRLRARLRQARRPLHAPSRVWWTVAATVAIALAATLVLPLLPGNGDAFAAVQARFRDFTTLSMTVIQRVDGQPLQTSQTVVDARGALRTDIGAQLSVIVDPTRGRVLTLLHDARQAMVATIPEATAAQNDTLRWLEDLRDFKGEATPLPGTRTIDGRSARGWSLRVGGATMEIWADADGLPLAMRQSGGGGLEIDYRFEFDRPIPQDHLSSDVPAGYALAASEHD